MTQEEQEIIDRAAPRLPGILDGTQSGPTRGPHPQRATVQFPSIEEPDATREAEQDRAIDRQNRKRGSDADRPTPEQAEAALEAIQKRSRMTVPKLLARYQERVESLGESIRLSEEVIKEEVACQKEYEQARHFWQKAIAEIERGEA